MKLKQLLLISLTAVPLFSCGGSKDPDDPVIDYTVTEEEFNHAMSFEGVNYLQINSKMIDMIGLERQTINKCAPDACLLVNISNDESNPYDEERIFRSKDGEDYLYWGYSNSNQVTPKWEEMETRVAETLFKSPTKLNFLLEIEKMGGDYHSFTVVEDNFYYARFETEDGLQTTQFYFDFYFRFENKILTSFKQIRYIKEDMTQVMSGEANITYEKEDIDKPL